jgi:hypothetical protein
VRDDIKGLGLRKEDAQDRVIRKGLTCGNRPALPKRGSEDESGFGLRSRDVNDDDDGDDVVVVVVGLVRVRVVV